MAERRVQYRVGKYPPPHIPIIPDKKTIMAIKAVHSGVANEGQQKLFLEFLIHDLCGAYDVGYHSGKIDDTAFAAGKRFVALNLRDLINFDVARLKESV
jgi:hypothetical protein